MTQATRHFHNRVAVVFDFDATLAPDSYHTLLRRCGLDPEEFRKDRVQPLVDDGWDATLARMYRLVQESREREERITRDFLARVGREVEPYPGVPEMFGRVREWARGIVPGVEVEFYLLTAGFVDLHRATPIAGEFEAMWGSELHFGEDGGIDFAKQIITYPEKVRYVLQLSKGLGPSGPNAPADVYRDVPGHELHVPLDQVVYVGDGGSDMPTFALLNDHGGMALGVFKESAEDWSALSKEHEGRRVQNLAKADYGEGSELMESLRLAVESICKRVALRRLSLGE